MEIGPPPASSSSLPFASPPHPASTRLFASETPFHHRLHLESISMSYADVTASGANQSAEEAAAPQPPEVATTETASTASPVDVDMPSVHTVPPDFLDQDVRTDTQSGRIDREAASSKAKADLRAKRDAAAARADRADSWITAQFAKLSDGGANALVAANLAAVVGLSSYLGYRAWGLYEKGRLTWQAVGLGVGVVAGVSAIEAVFGGYLYKGKGKKN